ncbi:DUF47 domain-containing protein [Georgenia alba]|uniref:DUF47 domain-containing protein n=1 Tax=Georgenia alba TaxID=2233858 RepID=A0ABW2QEE6_9MICO
MSAGAECLVRGARLLTRMVGADRTTRARLATELHAVEQEADQTTSTVLHRLDRTFVTPFDRRDLYALTTAIDDCMDALDEAADLMIAHRLGDLPADAGAVVGGISRCADLTADAVRALRTMNGSNTYRDEVVQLVETARRTYRRLAAEALDGAPDPVAALRVTRVLDALNDVAGRFRRLADVVQSLVLQEA